MEKRKQKYCILALLSLCALLPAGLTSCGGGNGGKSESSVKENAVASIEIAKQPTKTSYYVGEKFSKAGMVVNAVYANGTKKATLKYTIDKTGPLALEDKEIIVSYEGKTASVAITVTEKEIASNLNITSAEHKVYRLEAEDATLGSESLGIEKEKYIETPSDKTSGGKSLGNLNFVDNTIDVVIKSGVEANLSIEMSMAYVPSLDFDANVETYWNKEKITTNFIVAKQDGAESHWFDWHLYRIDGLKLSKGYNYFELKLSKDKLSANYDFFNFEVSPSDVSNLEVTTSPKTSYQEGEKFNPDSMVVKANYADGTSRTLDDFEYSYDNHNPLITEDKAIAISYRNVTVSLPIEVSHVKAMEGIKIKSMPNKTSYEAGDLFDPTGMEVVAVYDDDSEEAITNYDYDLKTELKVSDTKVIITYLTFTAEVVITVSPATVALSSIRIKTMPAKTSYTEGETFDPTGMEVEAVYDDSSTKTILGYEYDKRPLTVDDTSVTISYEGKTTSVNITVTEITAHVSIENAQNKTYRVEAEDATYLNSPGVENDGNASNGKAVGELRNNDITFYLRSSVEAKMDIALGLCHSPNIVIDEVAEITFNNEKITTGITVTSGWGDYQPYSIKAVNLVKGLNIFKIHIKDNAKFANFDYADFVVSPVEKEVSFIEVASQPTRTKYIAGESFDPAGMNVKATYVDETSETIAAYSYDEGALSAGTTSVAITYGGKSAEVAISVIDPMFVVASADSSTHRVEAEDAIIAKSGPVTETPEGASNGKSLGEIWGNTFVFGFSSSVETTLKVNLGCANPTDIVVDDVAEVFMNNVLITTGVTVNSGNWTNFTDFSINNLSVKTGTTIFKVVIKENQKFANWDYVDFVINPAE